MNKKSIELSLHTILGLVLAALVLIFLFAFLEDILSLFFPKPSAATTANFERLVDEIKNLEDGQTVEVPYYMYEKELKLVSEKREGGQILDKDCYTSDCICVCDRMGGCEKSRRLKECFGDYEVSIEHAGEYGIVNDEKRISILSVYKQSGKITIVDVTVKPPKEGMSCCNYITVIGDVMSSDYIWEDTCKEDGIEVPYSYCPKT